MKLELLFCRIPVTEPQWETDRQRGLSIGWCKTWPTSFVCGRSLKCADCPFIPASAAWSLPVLLEAICERSMAVIEWKERSEDAARGSGAAGVSWRPLQARRGGQLCIAIVAFWQREKWAGRWWSFKLRASQRLVSGLTAKNIFLPCCCCCCYYHQELITGLH